MRKDVFVRRMGRRGGVGKLMTRNHSMVEGSVVWVHRGLPLLALALFRFFQDFSRPFQHFSVNKGRTFI